MNIEKFKAIYGESRNGCNHFVCHPLVRFFHYSDGVQDLAETGCYWLLDIAATELPRVMRKAGELHGILAATVKNGKAKLTFSPTDETHLWAKKIPYTDLPDGTWSFELADEGERFAMILISEH
jgi:hypothetical protein